MNPVSVDLPLDYNDDDTSLKVNDTQTTSTVVAAPPSPLVFTTSESIAASSDVDSSSGSHVSSASPRNNTTSARSLDVTARRVRAYLRQKRAVPEPHPCDVYKRRTLVLVRTKPRGSVALPPAGKLAASRLSLSSSASSASLRQAIAMRQPFAHPPTLATHHSLIVSKSTDSLNASSPLLTTVPSFEFGFSVQMHWPPTVHHERDEDVGAGCVCFVTDVQQHSAASHAGLNKGDVILEIGMEIAFYGSKTLFSILCFNLNNHK